MTVVADPGYEEGPDDAESVVISWLSPLLPPGQVAITRYPNDPLPFILVNHLDSNESVEESWSDALVSVHILTRKTRGNEAEAAKNAEKVHRRMLRLAEWLEDVDLPDGRKATISSVSVAKGPKWVPYGDDQILRKVGRYTIGLDYATLL